MCCIELVSDRAKKSYAVKDVLQKVQDGAYKAGVMVRTSGNNIILSPPLIITGDDVSRILAALEVGLKAAAH
jgi:adenosylmethionine-8-amino-7-oxononanoate aminotransferase